MRWIVGALLVAAAILKGIQFVGNPAATLLSPLGGWLLPVQVSAELGVGLFVLSGIYWRQIRWLALLLFAAFAAYSLSLAIGGAASCGCFGPIKVHPWWTFLLDTALVVGLLISMRRTQSGSQPEGSWRMPSWPGHQAVAAVIVGLSVLSAAMLVRYASSRTAVAGDLLPTAGDLVILEPENWVGKPLPIAEAIRLDLSKGNWVVLLHRHDCPECQAAVPRYEQLATHDLGPQVALIEVPPYDNSVAGGPSASRHARLNDNREWFVQTPVEIQLADGIVTSASTELPALHASAGQ